MGNLAFIAPLANGGLSYAIENSTRVGWVICLILLLLSSFSWAAMIVKIMMIRRANRKNDEFLELYRSAETPTQLLENEAKCEGAPLFHIYHATSEQLASMLIGSPHSDYVDEAGATGRITPSQMNAIRSTVDRSIGEMTVRLESQMTILATAVSGAPFLGLLGTVWGVMDTFGSIAGAQGSPNLKVMAPGVSAALATTVVGLLVAIPAMFGYNFLVASIRSIMSRLDTFGAELLADIESRYVIEGAPAPAPSPMKREPIPEFRSSERPSSLESTSIAEPYINPVAAAVGTTPMAQEAVRAEQELEMSAASMSLDDSPVSQSYLTPASPSKLSKEPDPSITPVVIEEEVEELGEMSQEAFRRAESKPSSF